jgi:TetR/AcrR family transcriptional regulator, cholesterol catabolism regulator
MAKKNSAEKEKIIQVALDLFSEKGYAATSMRDIAAAMKMSISTTYYYFKDKENLLFTVLKESGANIHKKISDAKGGAEDPVEALRRMLMMHIRLSETDGKRAKIFVEDTHNLSEKYWKIIYKQHRKIYETYLQQLKEVQAAGMLKTNSLSIAVFAILGMNNWVYRWYQEDGQLTIDEIAKTLTQIISNGILKPESEAPKRRKSEAPKRRKEDK